MPVAELDLRAKRLRQELWQILKAPDHKSIDQLREEAIISMMAEVADEARMRALQGEIYAVGKTPEECIQAAALALEWGKVTAITDLEGGDPKYTWGRRFWAEGTSMKAAGWKVPGGFVLTWWK